MEIEVGVYENLISQAILCKLNEMQKNGFYIAKEKIDSADSNKFFANYLSSVVAKILKTLNHNGVNSTELIQTQIEHINDIFKYINDEWQIDMNNDYLSIETEFLRGIYNKVGYTKEQIEEKAHIHPVSGYRVSNLFTGSNRDLSIDQEIIRDIQTSDEIDLMVSFIRFTGLRLIIDALRSFIQRPNTKLRIITTTYMGATDPKAIHALYEMMYNGNVELKISYNTSQERLHAKAYIFNRANGLNTAYIGSSNLSASAMTKGLEWNMRVTSIENPHIIEKAQASFDYYWNNDNFESLTTEEDYKKFCMAIEHERHKDTNAGLQYNPILVRFERKTHQIKVLDQLRYERETLGSYKNLIIAATGTGKTAISAFDFKDFNKAFKTEHHREARLLFVVHRERILEQARATYRSVMADSNFGELWVGNYQPNILGNLDHLFVSIQTLNSHIDEFRQMGKDYYDYVVIDEAHHSAAGSYRCLFDLFNPKIFIGLTATPERMDGQAIKPDFNDRFAAEIRLYDALNQQLLCPFQYFCVSDDSVDLSRISFNGERYDTSELTDALCNERRIEIIDRAINKYLANPNDCKAVCFCAGIKHAEYVAQLLGTRYKTATLTSKNRDHQTELIEKLEKGDINYLCVADILNEGVDVPSIDTILFLRPTESLTVFIQQFGRGLRTADGKTELTVLDFVAQSNKNYDYGSRLRTLTGGSESSIIDGVENGFSLLPRGCSIEMEKQAQSFILETIRNNTFNRKRLTREIVSFESNTGQTLTLTNFLNYLSLDVRTIYKGRTSWNGRKRDAGLLNDNPSKLQTYIEGHLYQFLHINSTSFINNTQKVILSGFDIKQMESMDDTFVKMLYYDLYMNELKNVNRDLGTRFESIYEAIHAISKTPTLVDELSQLMDYSAYNLCQFTSEIQLPNNKTIDLYRCYSKDEIYINFFGKDGKGQIAGVRSIEDQKIQLLFCTINKSDHEYSASTMYEDYAIDANTFNWQSQNNVRIDSDAGRLYINQKENKWRFLLFVRDSKKDAYGFTNSYYCLGDLTYLESHGECPMTIKWHIENSIPGIILEKAIAG